MESRIFCSCRNMWWIKKRRRNNNIYNVRFHIWIIPQFFCVKYWFDTNQLVIILQIRPMKKPNTLHWLFPEISSPYLYLSIPSCHNHEGLYNLLLLPCWGERLCRGMTQGDRTRGGIMKPPPRSGMGHRRNGMRASVASLRAGLLKLWCTLQRVHKSKSVMLV